MKRPLQCGVAHLHLSKFAPLVRLCFGTSQQIFREARTSHVVVGRCFLNAGPATCIVEFGTASHPKQSGMQPYWSDPPRKKLISTRKNQFVHDTQKTTFASNSCARPCATSVGWGRLACGLVAAPLWAGGRSFTRCPESPDVCCEDIFDDENAQRPPQFHEIPRKLEKQQGRERTKKCEILDGPRNTVSGSGVSRAGCLEQACPRQQGAVQGVQGRGSNASRSTNQTTTHNHTQPHHPTHPPTNQRTAQPTNQPHNFLIEGF